MCIPNKILWCFVLVLIASYSASHESSTKILTNGNIKQSYNSTFQRLLDLIIDDHKLKNTIVEINSTRCNLHKNSISNEMPYEPYINSTKNETKNDNSEQYKFRRHIIKDYDEKNRRFLGGIGDGSVISIGDGIGIESVTELPIKSVTVPINNVDNCIRFCCPPYHYISTSGKCINGINYNEPRLYQINDSNLTEFCRITNDPCFARGFKRRLRKVSIIDGLLHQNPDKPTLPISDFCLATMHLNALQNDSIYHMIVCTNDDESKYPVYLSVCLLISLPFLLLTFTVYTVFPELQNVHGYTLRAYVVSLFITYVFMFCGTKISELEEVDDNICCTVTAYVFHFFFLSSFFWLNVICFDIWWTFRKIRLCRTNMKQAKKKFVMYSIYAWGIPLIITITCATMDYVDGIPENWKPKISVEAKTIYFYVPMVATVISNSFFFIATTVSIIHQTIRTANHLRTSNNKSFNKNKHRIKMFQKLFVMMIYGGIIWVIEVIAWRSHADFLPSFTIVYFLPFCLVSYRYVKWFASCHYFHHISR